VREAFRHIETKAGKAILANKEIATLPHLHSPALAPGASVRAMQVSAARNDMN